MSDVSSLGDEIKPFETSVNPLVRQLTLSGESDEPITISFEDISAAAYRIKHGIKITPCEKSVRLSEVLKMDVYLKKDFMQVTGSFKERGARNTLVMLSKKQKSRGVIAASAGNHALALAYHGRELQIPVTVVMPLNAPIMKINSCKKYGATIHVVGNDIIEAKEVATKIGKTNRLAYINGYDHPHILSGQGTMGLEIADQVENIDAIVIPVGGAGLLAGCATALKSLCPNIMIIAAESEECASYKAAMDAGHPVRIEANQSLTLADGLCVAKVGSNSFASSKDLVDKVVTVSEGYIAMAVLRLIEEEKCVVEGAGATGVAAALAGLLPELEGKRVVFPLCGGNIDSTVLGRVIERGLAADGRLIRFKVTVMDRPGGVAELSRLLCSIGASIKDIFHERAWMRSSVYTVQIKCVVETRDYEHGLQLKEALLSHYGDVIWGSESVHQSAAGTQE